MAAVSRDISVDCKKLFLNPEMCGRCLKITDTLDKHSRISSTYREMQHIYLSISTGQTGLDTTSAGGSDVRMKSCRNRGNLVSASIALQSKLRTQ